MGNRFEELEAKYPDTVVLQMQGTFYRAYNRSAYVISELTGYKLRAIKEDVCTCGFPAVCEKKVAQACSDAAVSYVMYRGEEISDVHSFENSRFQEVLQKGMQKIPVPAKSKDASSDKSAQEKNTEVDIGKTFQAPRKGASGDQDIRILEGCGISQLAALEDLKASAAAEILENGMRITAISLLESRRESNLYMIRGLAICEKRDSSLDGE